LIKAPATINEASGPYVHDSHTMVYASGQNGLHLTKDDYPDNATPSWTQVAGGANGGDNGLLAYQARTASTTSAPTSASPPAAPTSRAGRWTRLLRNRSCFIIGDGEKLFAAARGGFFYTTPEANPSDVDEAHRNRQSAHVGREMAPLREDTPHSVLVDLGNRDLSAGDAVSALRLRWRAPCV
jgi:hypothetical protein